MTCPKCRSKIFLKFATINECVNCGFKIEQLEGWHKDTRKNFIK